MLSKDDLNQAHRSLQSVFEELLNESLNVKKRVDDHDWQLEEMQIRQGILTRVVTDHSRQLKAT